MTQFFILLALDILGLAAIWFLLKARLRRALEVEGLLAEARRELRALSLELNETADRNITLLEDRLESLRDLLAEADRRLGLYRREIDNRAAEREVYTRLGRPRAASPGAERIAEATPPPPKAELDPFASRAETAGRAGAPSRSIEEAELRTETPVRLELGKTVPAVSKAAESVIPRRPMREEALDLYRKGFSADLIAARLGVTVAEIELLVSLADQDLRGEEDRESAGGRS